MPARAAAGWLTQVLAVIAAGCSRTSTDARVPGAAGPMPPTVAPEVRPGGEIARGVRLAQGDVTIVVRFDEGREAWGQYVADTAARYLPAAEAYLGVPFHRAAVGFFRNAPFTILIRGRDDVRLGSLHIRAYNNTSGFFGPDRGIFVEYSLTRIGNPALICHELTHFWFADRAPLTSVASETHGVPWFNEGVASALPLAALEAGAFSLEPGERTAIREHWGLTGVANPDVPVIEDLRPRGQPWLSVFYAKTFKAQYILHAELGGERYRRFLHAAADRRPQTSNDVLALLQQTLPNDWRALLSGWVFEGAYAKYTPESFKSLSPR